MQEPVKDLKLAMYPVGDMTQGFGENKELYASMGLDGHNGIDIVRPWGEHLFAVEDGTICNVVDDPKGYGKHIRIISVPDSNGRIHDWVYGHMSFIAVKNGQKVRAGQYVGNIGNTGFVVSDSNGAGYWSYNPYSGTHLHFGIRDVVHDKSGFKYSGYDTGLRVVEYDNGYKGRYDPVPILRDQSLTSTRAENLARARNSKLYMTAAMSLRRAGF